MSSISRGGKEDVIRTIHRALQLAQEHKHEAVTLEHLLVSLLKEADVLKCLKALKIDHEPIEKEMEEFMAGDYVGTFNGMPRPTETFNEVVMRTVGDNVFNRNREAMPVDLLVTLLQVPHEDSHAVTALLKSGLTALKVKKYVSHGASASASAGGADVGEMGAQAEISTPEEAQAFLANYCLNLNEEAASGKIDPLIGREEEVSQVIQIIARRTKNNAALVGETGVGKTAIAEGLALKIVAGEVPEIIKESVVYSLDIGLLVAGTRFRGDMEERMKNIIKAVGLIENSILFIDEIHTIMGAGSTGNSGGLDIANLLKPALSKGTLRCIGSTTHDEFRKHFEKDRALMRRFKKVEVREPDIETAKLILRGLAPSYETFHGVTYTAEAIDAAVDLTARYINNATLPDKAIDIMDGAGARQRVRLESQRTKVITIQEIEFEVSKVARIPEKTIKESETDKLVHLETDLQKAVFGQDDALEALADAVFVSRSGLRDTNKPAGAFLFAGPTGVGKTEAARQLATTLNIPLIKFDMSEYMEKHSVAKLIGAPPGYVGYGDGTQGSGKLINDVESNPYSILLLDEIEKAHPDVFNIFLQVMDDAKLTSSSGKTIDFRNVIIIMTTNAGAADVAKNPMGFSGSGTAGDPTPAINRMFSPEFRNRLDAIVNFAALKPENVIKVVDKFVRVLVDQAQERGVQVTFTDEAKEWLAKNGYDSALGARPLSRAIHKHVKKPLSRLMVTGSLKNGGSAVVEVVGDGLAVRAA